ncbi:nuclease-related domain-containing protein [Virgibacillus ndiopensis]|uniref:nuclease-related domain-containing protein n=1 Tax=Virgibacillus ndiopensis TaxID=2004408 RepID=UPI000C08CC48|nr:nuclease-related domain-containing protein [Virgibacillus ndiopensis]
MLLKDREIPIEILILEAILRRLPSNHLKRSKIEEDLRKRYAGYFGEESIDYHLSFLEDNKYMFLHNLRLPWKEGTYFQIDTLILSPFYFILLEVKNMIGTLFFDEPAKQLIRTKTDGTQECFPYPTTQVNRHVLQLNSWLRLHKFPNIPIISYVVLSSTSTMIKTNSNDPNFHEKVTHAMNLPSKIHLLVKQYPNKILTLKKQKKIADQLILEHSPSKPAILNWYDIKREELLKGLYCEDCTKLSVKRKSGSWKCTNCNSVSKVAHIRGLLDYFLLIDHTITNRQFNSFFTIGSRSVTTKLLQKLNLPSSGSYKDKKYHLSLAGLESWISAD